MFPFARVGHFGVTLFLHSQLPRSDFSQETEANGLFLSTARQARALQARPIKARGEHHSTGATWGGLLWRMLGFYESISRNHDFAFSLK